MKIIAVAMISSVSRKPRVPSARWRSGKPSPPITAPIIAAPTRETETGSLNANVPTKKTPTMAKSGHISGRY